MSTEQDANFAVPILPNYANSNDIMQQQNSMPSTSSSSFVVPSASSAAAAAAVIRRRRFSTAKIQPTRIKKVMQSDEEIGRMVQSVPVSIGRAMEHFAEKLLQAASDATQYTNSKTLTPQHMKQAMLATPHFRFLEPVLKEVILPQASHDLAMARYAINVQEQQKIQEQMNLEALKLQQQQLPSLNNKLQQWDQLLLQQAQNANAPAGMPMNDNNSAAAAVAQIMSSCQDVPMSPTTPTSSLVNGMMEMLKNTSQQINAQALKLNGVKRQSSETIIEDVSDKPKRGRPKKKKPERCIDDELVEEATIRIEKEDKDRELMPPPSLPIGVPRT